MSIGGRGKMKIRWIVMVTIVLFILCGIWGGIEKQNYTRIANEKQPLNFFSVGVFQDESIEILNSEEYQKSLEQETKYVLKVKAVSALNFEFLHTSQLFEVEEVYQGEGIDKGETISIALENGNLFFESGLRTANLGFANTKKIDKEYLVYLNEELIIPKSQYRVFTVSGLLVAPFFAYELEQSKPLSEMGYKKEQVEVRYNEICDNAYFAYSRKGLDALLAYRERMIKKYT